MAILRQKIKQKLIGKQHKNYKKEVSVRKITYAKWIAEREKNLEIEQTIRVEKEKKQTIDLITKDFDGKNLENEGINSNNEGEFELFSTVDQNSHIDEKAYFACISANELYENTNTLFEQQNVDFVAILVYNGRATKNAYPMICKQFQNENVVLVYGDEDMTESEIMAEVKSEIKPEDRKNPWLKPDWSPDRFLAGFYLGGLISVRFSALKDAWKYCKENRIFEKLPANESEKEWLYLLLFEMLKMQNCFAKRNEAEQEKVCHIKQVLYTGCKNGYERVKSLKLSDFISEDVNNNKWDLYNDMGGNKIKENLIDGYKKRMLSIIIPSKDNPEVLFHCLDSLLSKTSSSYPYEIILVDNGSNEENKEKIARKVREINENRKDEKSLFVQCKYLYEQMTFNFSKMCNLGAENGTGEILLFLNDDMEIVQPEWMNLMMEKAMLPYAGAVGAKLLYPDSDIIQHAGVTNLRVGPAHKLQYLSDKENHYFGMNRGVHNMLAVTGACLMVRREVFLEAGGFCEDLAVAFNDVDLCYTIYEKGYYNIVRNDVILFHHESLSRGKDGESEEKQLRHLKEKDLLYERHLELYGKDPFYHPDLLNDMLDSKYSMGYCNQVTLDMAWSKLVPCQRELKKAREDECLVVGMECARDIYRWLYSISPKKGEMGEDARNMGYYFQGYSFIIGADNACYSKKFLLKNKINNQVMAIAAEARYRQDIENNLPDQVNVGLTGFAAKLPKEAIPAGIYQFGILAEDRCSRQKLVNWSNWVMEVEADGRECVREGKE